MMTDCETNKSSARVSRMSAGTRSPAERRTRSPTTSAEEGMPTHLPPRRTVTSVEIIPVRRSAMRLARSSCRKRTAPLSSSMQRIRITVVPSRLKLDANTTSVKKDRIASTSRTMENGLMKARHRRYHTVSDARPDRTFSPYCARLAST